jgi:hypothetical protein
MFVRSYCPAIKSINEWYSWCMCRHKDFECRLERVVNNHGLFQLVISSFKRLMSIAILTSKVVIYPKGYFPHSRPKIRSHDSLHG